MEENNRKIIVTPGAYFSEAWEIFKQDAVSFIAFTLIILIVPTIVELVLPENSTVSIVINLVTIPLYMGYFIQADNIFQNKPRTFSNFFDGFKSFSLLVLVAILSFLLIMLGIVALILPGIYLSVAYLFASPLVYFNKLSAWKAMETSRKIVTKNWWTYFGFFWLIIIINIAGILALGIGLLVSFPVSYIAIYIAYRKEFPVENTAFNLEDHLIA